MQAFRAESSLDRLGVSPGTSTIEQLSVLVRGVLGRAHTRCGAMHNAAPTQTLSVLRLVQITGRPLATGEPALAGRRPGSRSRLGASDVRGHRVSLSIQRDAFTCLSCTQILSWARSLALPCMLCQRAAASYAAS